MQWSYVEEGKTRGGRGITLLGRRQTIIGVIPGIAGKTKSMVDGDNNN